LIGIYDKVGSIDAGKLANFIITSGPVFNEKTILYQNWVLGRNILFMTMAGTTAGATTNLP